MSLPTFIKVPEISNILKDPKFSAFLSDRPDLRSLSSDPERFVRNPEIISVLHSLNLIPDYSVQVNPIKDYTKPFTLLTDNGGTNPELTVVAANATSGQIAMPIDTSGHYEAAYFYSKSDGPYTIQIQDPTRRQPIMNNEIHINTIAGTGGKKYILPETYFANVGHAPRTLFVQFRNLINQTNNIRFAIGGRKWYVGDSPIKVREEMLERFGIKERTNAYFLTTDTTVILTSGQENTFDITTDNNGDFEVIKLSAYSTGLTGEFKIQIREKATNRTLSNGFVHSSQMFGSGEFPEVLFESLLIRRNYRLALDIVNLDTTTATIYITLAGRRLWYPPY